MNTLIYKNYQGNFDYDNQADIFYGEVVNINKDIITFQGRSIDELKLDLQEAIEDYFDFCKAQNKAPEPPILDDILSIKISKQLKNIIENLALKQGQNLNTWIVNTLNKATTNN